MMNQRLPKLIRIIATCFSLATLLFIAGCTTDEPSPAGPEPEASYMYPGFILNIAHQDIIRVTEGKPDGNIFVYPDEIRASIMLSFLDSSGKTVTLPPDSVVVLFKLEDASRISIQPGSLPDPVFGWRFSLGAERIGVTQLRISFLPEGVCRETTVAVHAVG